MLGTFSRRTSGCVERRLTREQLAVTIVDLSLRSEKVNLLGLVRRRALDLDGVGAGSDMSFKDCPAVEVLAADDRELEIFLLRATLRDSWGRERGARKGQDESCEGVHRWAWWDMSSGS